MDATLELQLPTVNLVEMLPDEVKAVLVAAGFTLTDLDGLVEPKYHVNKPLTWM